MKQIKIAKNENGSHDNQTCDYLIPGYAVIPDDMETPNFPFGDVEVSGSLVTKWTPLPIPEAPEKSNKEKREEAYETEKLIEWDGGLLTVDEANKLWADYSAEKNTKADELSALIAEAKAKIREKYPDEN